MKPIRIFLICLGVLASSYYLSSHTSIPSLSKDLSEAIYCDPIDSNQSAIAIRNITAGELAKRYKLSPCGFGGAGMTVFESLHLTFETQDIYTISEARSLLVNCANCFASNINTYKPIRPYLVEYPFPVSRAHVAIFCRNKQNATTAGSLSYFTIRNGVITYTPVPPEGVSLGQNFHADKQESYADAHAIVKQEGKIWSPQNVDSVNSKTITKTLGERRAQIKQRRLSRDYLTTKYHSIPSALLDATLDTYGEDIAEKYDLLLHREGKFIEKSEKDFYNTLYGLSFQSEGKLTQEQARLFATTLFRDFYQKMLTDPIVKDYHAKHNERAKNRKYPSYITPEPDLHQICWKLAFWDKNVDRPEQPYIAEIQFKNAAFHYYVADPSTHALKLIFEEPYDEAVKHLDQQSSASSK